MRVRRVTGTLAATCALLALTGGNAWAGGSEYFYYENWLAPGHAVSGAPHAEIYFVGAYTSYPTGEYCVGWRIGTKVTHRYCVYESNSLTISISPAEPERGEVYDAGPYTKKFIAEERWH